MRKENAELEEVVGKSLQETIDTFFEPTGHKFPTANVEQINGSIEFTRRGTELITAELSREIIQNCIDYSGNMALLGKIVIDDLLFYAILTNSQPFSSVEEISSKYFSTSVSGNKGQSMFGNGAGVTPLAACKVKSIETYIVGSKIGRRWQYVMAKRQGMDYPRAEITEIISKKIENAYGKILDDYTNLFLVPICDTKDKLADKMSEKVKVLLSPTHVNVICRLCGDKLLSEFKKKNGSLKMFKNIVLDSSDSSKQKNLGKVLINIPLNCERDKKYCAEEIMLNIESETNGKIHATQCVVNVETEVKIKIFPGFKNASGHFIAIRDEKAGEGDTHFGEGEEYNLICKTSDIGNNESKDAKISSRFEDQPIYTKPYGSNYISKTLGLSDLSFERNLNRDEAIKVLEFMKQNGVDADYEKLKSKIALASPYLLYETNSHIKSIRCEEENISTNKPDFFSKSNIVGTISNAFYTSDFAKFLSFLFNSIKGLRTTIDQKIREKLEAYFMVPPLQGIAVNLENAIDIENTNIIVVDHDKTESSKKIVEFVPFVLESLAGSSPQMGRIKFFDAKKKQYLKHMDIADITAPLKFGERTFGTGTNLDPILQDDKKELWSLTVGTLKKINKINNVQKKIKQTQE